MRALVVAALFLILGPGSTLAAPSSLAEIFETVPADVVPSGILLDRVLPLAGTADLDGSSDVPVVDRKRWRQAYHEVQRAGANDLAPVSTWWSEATGRRDVVPVAILDLVAERLRPEADFGRGLTREGDRIRVASPAVESRRVFTAAALVEQVYDRRVVFDLGDRWRFGGSDSALEFDADDGVGWRAVPADGRVAVEYASIGTRTLAVRTRGTESRVARFVFEVVALAVPAPQDTIRVTSTVAFEGDVASGDAFVYLAPGRTALEVPVIFVEGLDLDDSLGRDELYTLLNGENLLEDLRGFGYDVVVLDFDDATTFVQSNGLLVAELVQEVQRRIASTTRLTLAGASMGGVCSRYALAWMESQEIEHRVDLLVSFDAPHRGANIPLGLQFWVDFFREESAQADFLASRLDRPAARQLLVYHYRATTVGSLVDPLRGALEADLAALGSYPAQPRLVAVANGGASEGGQVFGPGQKILEWDYSSFFTGVTGNVWAVGDGPSTRIFEGEIRAFFIPISGREISVSNTDPYDDAPGGTRASMQQAADVPAPYGDILALHPAHDFIPTVSALDLADVPIDVDVSTVVDPASSSPFDAVYAPTGDQEHVLLTVENAAWFRAEILGIATGAPSAIRAGLRLFPARPNPFNPSTTVSFEVERTGPVRLGIYDPRGRLVLRLVDEVAAAGRHRVSWDGRDGTGTRVASGVYHLRLDQGARAVSGRVVLVE